ncbi:MAG TPA: hypothetical protein VD902_20065, partial [Symbiobacteriaceae bacterium]|nr:hypothetical protein [Symbiobacteriaceae bacterium]
NVHWSISKVIFTIQRSPFRGLACHCSQDQDSTEHAFGLSKTGGVFLYAFNKIRRDSALGEEKLHV